VQLHRRIGDWEEAASGTRVGEIAAELAMHFERGQDYPRAVQYLTQAADIAKRRHAYQEEISLLTIALEILKLLPDTAERVHHELALLITLGVPLLTTKGYAAPEVQQTYAQARKDCQRLSESPQLLPALGGLFRFYFVRAELQMAGEVAEQVLRLAEQTSDTTMFLVAHSVLGVLCLCRGELVTAHRHLTAALALYSPEHLSFLGTPAAMTGDVRAALPPLALWFLGYPTRQSRKRNTGCPGSESHSHGVVFAQDFLTWIHLYRGEARAAQAWSEALQPVAIERGFQFLLADNQVLYGMVVAEQGKEAEGCAEIQAGVRAYQATGARMSRPSQLAWLARAHGMAGRVTEGLAVLEEALAIANDTQERSVEAELWRLKGELTLQQSRSQRRGPRSKKSASFKLHSSQLTNTESRPLILDPERAAETYFLTALAIAL
jgi:predicted ATPase